MARTSKQDQNKAKAAKQKKIAIGGGVLLVALLGIQVPRTMKMMGGKAKPPVVSTTAADGTTTTTAAPTDPNSLAAPTLAGSPTATTATAADTSSLVASVPLKVDQGQLENFQRFVAKDPFAAQVSTDGKPIGSSGSSSGSSSSPKSGSGSSAGGTTTTPVTVPSTTPSTPSTPPAQPSAPAPTTAVISLNGVLMSVAMNTDFPTAAPVFHLVSLTASTAKVAISGGSYADGSAAITLKLKAPVTLQNTADGTKYTLILEPASTAVTSAAPAAGASTTPSSVPAVPSGSGG